MESPRFLQTWSDRSGKDDGDDAFIDSILPELAEFFASLFREDENTVLGTLNGLLLAAYTQLPGFLQFLFRLFVNRKLETLQRKWPSWASVPVLIFVRAYLGALEEASKDKPKASAADIRAMLAKVAVQAKDATSDLGKKFQDAKEAAKHINIPHPNSKPKEGSPMSDTHHAPPKGDTKKPAGNTGDSSKKSGIQELLKLFSGIASGLPAITEGLRNVKTHMGHVFEDAEYAAKMGSHVLLTITIAMVLTGFGAIWVAVSNPMYMMAYVTTVLVIWGLGPLLAGVGITFLVKNGFGKLGIAAGAVTLTGGLSSLVIATVCGIAAFTDPFSWVYVALNLGCVIIADFVWRFGDLSSDGIKALIRAMPDNWEANWMKRGTIGFRKAMFTIVVADTLAAFLVSILAMWDYTLYGVQFLILIFATGLVAAYGYSRVPLTENTAPSDLVEIARDHRVLNLARFYWAGTGLVGIFLAIAFVFNMLAPPAKDATGELPSYAARWEASRLHSALADRGDEMVDAIDPIDACDAKIVAFVNGLEEVGGCKAVLTNSTEPKLIALCEQAKECGLVSERGVRAKPAAKPSVVDASIGSFGSGWWCVGIGVIALVFFAWIGRKQEGEEEKKPAGGGHH